MRHSLIGLIICNLSVLAQGTVDDYQRASRIREFYDRKVTQTSIIPNWIEEGEKFWYTSRQANGKSEHFIVDAAAATKKLATWREPPKPERPRSARDAQHLESKTKSPDGKWEVFFREENVWVRELASNAEEAFSFDGTVQEGYRGDVYWSPDSQKFIAFRIRHGDDRIVTFIESSPKGQIQPIVRTQHYLKPGDAIDQWKPELFRIVGSLKLSSADSRLDSLNRRDDTLVRNSWSLSHFHWDRESRRFSFLYNSRGHQIQRLLAIDASNGKCQTIFEEKCPTFFDYSNKTYLRRLANGELIWMSERSGYNHLYRIDGQNGTVKNPVTEGRYVVRAVEHIDEEKQLVWFRMFGYHKGRDPYYSDLARIRFDGSGFTLLTDGDGTHDVQWSPNGKYFIDTCSKIDEPPVHVLRHADGSKSLLLEALDVSELKKAGWKPPETFALPGRDDKTLIYGYIVRPSNFEPTKKYPVIEHIYAGPHSFFVQKRFSPTVYESVMAELGFIIVKMDGMGTNWRSKSFHDVSWKNLVDSGFPDRIKVIRQLAAKYPEMDLSKGVGIYGGSAGGQSALAGLLHHGEFYTVGVADCGCHDNRMDKIWWNEAWMGTMGPHYAAQSNVTNAHKLKGKLMLIVGEVDRNVDPASTMQVANALIKANKDFDLLVMPGVGHGAAETPYANRRRQDFFVRNLMGVEPRR